VPALFRGRNLIAGALRVLGQLSLSYHDSPWSTAAPHRPGAPPPGSRLPDLPVVVARCTVGLHDLTAAPGVHLLLDRDAPPLTLIGEAVHVERLISSPGRGLVVIRPDGYVGTSAERADDPGLSVWLAAIGTPVPTQPITPAP
jgi:hypothetical protein